MNKVKSKKARKPKASKPKLIKRTVPLPSPFWETEILTIDQLARTLQLAKKTIYLLIKANKIPATKIGNKFRFSKRAVLAAFEEMGKSQEDKG
jgi:excisionase family DNA binding protein